MKFLTKTEIEEQIHLIAKSCNCKFIGKYEKAKTKLQFLCLNTNEIIYASWDNIKQRKKIPRRKQYNIFKSRILNLEKEYNITILDEYVDYVTKLNYKCNYCNQYYLRNLCSINICHCKSKPYKNNKGINTKNVLKDPFKDYYLYFVEIPEYNVYKIGLYRKKYIKSRFKNQITIINIRRLPLYKAYFLEQLIINKFKEYKYDGLKFGGYTEAFNKNIPINEIILFMGASLKDVEPCELLGTLEADNQQLSLNSDIFESSTTRIESH